jgi:sulfur-carrier protein adenylyltransferase/sulfurtransferase
MNVEMNKPDEAEITVEQLQEMLKRKEDFVLLDVRLPEEYEICNLHGRLIPLNELSHRLGELDKNKPIIVHCKSGGRSYQAMQLLKHEGFVSVRNLEGGITAWAQRIDLTMPTY